MLTVGDRFPEFCLTGVVGDDPASAFRTVSRADLTGRWSVVFAWPKDFTFVCPTEIAEFGRLQPRFAELGAEVLGLSVDNEYVHLAWRRQDPILTGVGFPMLSDLKRELSSALGILDRDEGVALRATFLVDPEGVIRHVSVNDLDTGRNPEEILRVLAALQSGGLTACGWQPGDPNLKAA